MVYDWILSPLNNSYDNISTNTITYLFNNLVPRLADLILTPIVHPKIFWIVLPLIIATTLMILYFGRYRNEQLGWNTAFSNNIVLVFVSIDLIKHLFESNSLLNSTAFFVYFVLLYNTVQLVLNYFHLIPKYVSFVINSTIPINVMQYLAILLTYSNIPFDSTTLIASGLLLILIYGISKLIWMIVPISRGAKIFKTKEEKKEAKKKINEERKLKMHEDLKKKDAKLLNFGIITYLSLYLVLMVINKIFIDLTNVYLIILSAYFLSFSAYYIKKKKIKIQNLLIEGNKKSINLGIIFGFLIFFYYIISSNFFIQAFNINGYITNNIMLIFNITAITISGELFFRGILQRGLKVSHEQNYSVGLQALLWALLKQDFFNITLITIPNALIGIIIVYPIGLLLGYMKEEWSFDATISASVTNALLSIISLVL